MIKVSKGMLVTPAERYTPEADCALSMAIFGEERYLTRFVDDSTGFYAIVTEFQDSYVCRI